jgi:chromosomal replication initiator protein
MKTQGTELWQAVSEAFERLRGERARSLWLDAARPAGFRRGLFTLDVASESIKVAIDARYREDLESIFREVTGSPVRVLTRVAGSDASPLPEPVRGARRGADLARPEQFVITACNRLAHRALERFVMAPEAGWNPLFVFGPAGSGKTELARHALARLREGGEVADPLVLSGPALTSDITRAARTGGLASRRAEWLGRDLLVLDEAHRLRGQRRTQAETAALLEGLLGRGRRVLVLSRHAPQDLQGADPRLLSWYLSGMVVGLGEPDTAAREAVLAAVAESLGVPVAAEVSSALAARCPGSLSDAVRVLQRAAREAARRGATLDLELLDRRLAGPTPAEATMRAVIEGVSRATGIAGERICSSQKSRDVASARHLCAFLGTHSLQLPARQVCRSLGQASPSLVAYARRAVQRRRETDPAYDALVHELQARLQGAQRDFAW